MTRDRQRIFLAAIAATALPLVFHCGHGQSRCAAYRSPRPRLPAPPADPSTLHAVEEAGFRYERCENRPRYRLVRAGTRALTFDELSALHRGLHPETPGPFWSAIGFPLLIYPPIDAPSCRRCNRGATAK